MSDAECVRCIKCKLCVGACECTGGPVLDYECTCYELTGGHQPGCYCASIGVRVIREQMRQDPTPRAMGGPG